jgi:hypothetical protein
MRLPTLLITIEQRRDHAEAVRRLAEIASEYPEQQQSGYLWVACNRAALSRAYASTGRGGPIAWQHSDPIHHDCGRSGKHFGSFQYDVCAGCRSKTD